MSLNRRTATANGNTLDLWGQGYDAEARRVAAALPRDCDGLDRVESGTDIGAVCWFKPPEGAVDEVRNLPLPETYRVTNISQFADGTVAYNLQHERAEVDDA